MADEALTPVTAPVVDNSSPAPVTPTPAGEAAPTPSPELVQAAPAPVETPTPAPVEPAPTPSPEAPKQTTLLAAEPKPVETPPEAPKEAASEEPKNEGGQSVEPAPPPKYEPFTLPENVKLGETELGEFTNLLAELEITGKADHAVVQTFGQKLVDFHLNELNKAVESVHNYNLQTWEDQKTAWKDEFIQDPEIGGNRFQTTVDTALNLIRAHGGTPEQQTEFRQLMNDSGLGNHKVMIRFLANVGAALSEGRPIAASAAPAAPKSKVTTLYGKG